jgi:carboxymethylenebutenolidase
MGEWITTTVDGGEMRCYVAIPDGASGVGAMAVMHGGPGWDATTEEAVDNLAAHGVAAIGPDLFHRGLPDRPEGGGPRSGGMKALEFVADVNAALAYVAGQPGVTSDRIGVMGFCMGGQVSYLTAGHNPDLKAAVCFYPGFVFNRLASGEDQAPFDTSANIKCPTLIMTGEDDGNPSPEMADRMDAALTEAGTVHEMVLYPGTAHAFMSKGGDSYREHAATDGWKRALEWIDRYL